MYKWSEEKDKWLRENRKVSFEEIVNCIQNGGLLDRTPHPNPENYPGQKVFVVKRNNYVYLVPFVEDADELFLKTIIPSRKATKLFMGDKRNG